MNDKLTIQELVKLLAEKHQLSRNNADTFAREFFALIQEAVLQDKYVKIKGLGTFKLIEVESRESVNVNTGQRFEIQGHSKISFTPDNSLKELINRPFAHFETVPLQNEALLETTPIEEEETQTIEWGQEVKETPISAVGEQTVQTTQLDHLPTTEENVPKNPETQSLTEHTDKDTSQTIEETQQVAEETPQIVEETQETDEEVLTHEKEMSKPEDETKETPEEERQQSDKKEAESSERGNKQTEEIKEQRKVQKFFIAIVILVSLFCIGTLAFLYFPSLSRSIREFQSIDHSPEYIKEVEKVNEVQEVKPVEEVKEEELKPTVHTEPVVPTFHAEEGVEYEIDGTLETHTMKEGETLIRLSLKYWGIKSLWPYLVRHNSDIIKDPDNVPYGVTLKIPKLKKK